MSSYNVSANVYIVMLHDIVARILEHYVISNVRCAICHLTNRGPISKWAHGPILKWAKGMLNSKQYVKICGNGPYSYLNTSDNNS